MKKVRESSFEALQNGTTIKLYWVPSHIGIEGNVRADHLASRCGMLDKSSMSLPYQDFYPVVRSLMQKEGKRGSWSGAVRWKVSYI